MVVQLLVLSLNHLRINCFCPFARFKVVVHTHRVVEFAVLITICTCVKLCISHCVCISINYISVATASRDYIGAGATVLQQSCYCHLYKVSYWHVDNRFFKVILQFSLQLSLCIIMKVTGVIQICYTGIHYCLSSYNFHPKWLLLTLVQGKLLACRLSHIVGNLTTFIQKGCNCHLLLDRYATWAQTIDYLFTYFSQKSCNCHLYRVSYWHVGLYCLFKVILQLSSNCHLALAKSGHL